MDLPVGGPGDQGFVVNSLAVAVVDGRGVVTGWSSQAARLLDRPASRVCGHRFQDLYAPPGTDSVPTTAAAGVPRQGRVELRRGDRGRIEVDLWTVPLTEDSTASAVLFADAAETRAWGYGTSLLRTVLTQGRVAVAVRGMDLGLVFHNAGPQIVGAPAVPAGSRLDMILSPQDAADADASLRRVRDTGIPVVADVRQVRFRQVPDLQRALSLTAYRLQDAGGAPSGVVTMTHDVTEQQRVGDHLDLLHDAAERIGFSLDLRCTAQALADVAVTGFGDLSIVDLAASVLRGDEPPLVPGDNTALVRMATASSTGVWPGELLPRGSRYPVLRESSPFERVQRGETVVLDRDEVLQWAGEASVEKWVPDGAHSVVVAPLFARGLLLGAVTVWRVGQPRPFDASEAGLLTQISSRAALGIDNARRFARERNAVLTLQERLLPRPVTDTPAARTAGVYRPAGGRWEPSGDWFDVITLPSLRVAFVVGDVVGRGLRAAANMGRLRAAVQTYANLELEPAEVLAHMEDLVQQLAAEAPEEQGDSVGATCLYAVYDPTTRQCVFASAGHPPPVVVRPDGTSELVDVEPGPPLGVGGVPFQGRVVDVEPDSLIAMFTDGLFGLRSLREATDSLERLQERLRALSVPGRALEQIGEALVAEADEQPPRDDIALLLTRTRPVPSRNVAAWEFPADLSAVAQARQTAARQLAAWDLDELTSATELVVSELVTNAARYAGGPVRLRLLRDDSVLICEVSDPSNTQPRVLRASSMDEGGRGLFLVAQCTARWGCRYGRRGKTIWTEQPLDGRTGQPVPVVPAP
ncbi:Serine phosphatase RsbU, regulator of sigma subunit [Streptomyces sp. DvalAA-14]|uniref:ATP-binding SpoIIE family protein phosphatase n=1 Tax=unclassified Streptomyces TaxID=2593676 RepID=UPI00081B699F|nr:MULTISPECIES: SpoIIE family protein phosphatase [unclassified Streptomyces]MYS23754.1 SpoIIE family protein phosphatase [Streptomyces sp. SID4948]SCE38314.1 Serine phosphatase RsbU, regulator of sigma subunit [Streptomyces sp. DvalAA-14]